MATDRQTPVAGSVWAMVHAGRVVTAGAEGWRLFVRELGHRLAGARVAKGWSQAELAAAASISVGACQRLESGESKHREPANPQLSTLAGVCGALGLRIGDLLPDWCPDVTGNAAEAD
jgi:DNA-binding Xre family transcriptional regulator